MQIHSSIETYNDLPPIVTMGTFDGVHPGHRALLHRVSELARNEGAPSVALTFWPHPRIVLSQDAEKLRLLTTLEEKTKIISEAGIDHLIVVPFTKELAALAAKDFVKTILINKLRVKHLVIGFNHRFGKGGTSLKEIIKLSNLHGFDVSQFRHIDIHGQFPSSTKIRDHLLKGEVIEANILLGYQYTINGQVTGGMKLGRSINYPTANLMLSEKAKLVPLDGVYACNVQVMGKSYGGMVNIGVRPTVNHQMDNRSIEVHILDFQGDIYSEEISLRFVARTRDEMKFANIDELRLQLQKDEIEIRKILSDHRLNFIP
ncbi:bifunctional riboflavin kinase/FAD synthetase [Alkalitalea saponilacus]|uniref:Riboflavin biosynthesis protein n=1 Tax=Alkalitalea saponilacus TaxID=889453 RepID=A0A1T5A7Z7_9BACT|nr:bifunctional riboflavin kinase/FAD synthetase [Alkalitalea saponilacus]ASB48810.1 riboflavin biosynthesis protein RibF [Alkalitalea saponilacus]SKB31035.1 riboflavin kinase / FMN adenylyltransferase [Alkalitalea saponilacus]